MTNVVPNTNDPNFDPLTSKPAGDLLIAAMSFGVTAWQGYRFLTSKGKERMKFGRRLMASLGLDALVTSYFVSKYAGA